jgi:hypothetical protein
MDNPETPVRSMILDGYASPTFGALIAARAKASSAIKGIVRDKKAKVQSRRDGAASYEYAYADLSDVIEAVEDALSTHELAVIQQTQERSRGAFLVTVLGHSSGEWVASEIRLQAVAGGPQAHGSEMTYLRRYQLLSILGLATERDDDGRAGQERADQRRSQERFHQAVHAEQSSRPPARPVPVSPPAAEPSSESAPVAPSAQPTTQADIDKFEAGLVKNLSEIQKLDDLDDYWRSGVNARVREIGDVDKAAQNRMISAFSTRKNEILKGAETEKVPA